MERENKTALWIVVGVIVVIVIAALLLLFTSNPPAETDNTTNPNNQAQNENTNEFDSNNQQNDLDQENLVMDSLSFGLNSQNDSGQDGVVLFEEVGNQVRVSINLTNPSGVSQPAHIHAGSCPTPGNVVYPLENVINGVSTTMIATSFNELRNMSSLAVNVHKSAEESEIYVSCGDLTF